MKVIIHGIPNDGTGLFDLAVAAFIALNTERPADGLLGLCRGDKYFSVKWNKSSISVWQNP